MLEVLGPYFSHANREQVLPDQLTEICEKASEIGLMMATMTDEYKAKLELRWWAYKPPPPMFMPAMVSNSPEGCCDCLVFFPALLQVGPSWSMMHTVPKTSHGLTAGGRAICKDSSDTQDHLNTLARMHREGSEHLDTAARIGMLYSYS